MFLLSFHFKFNIGIPLCSSITCLKRGLASCIFLRPIRCFFTIFATYLVLYIYSNRRLYEHLYYVTTKKMDEPSAQHFCQAGHNGHDLIALGLEHVRSRDPFILRAREHLLIKKFDSYRNGLNQEP